MITGGALSRGSHAAQSPSRSGTQGHALTQSSALPQEKSLEKNPPLRRLARCLVSSSLRACLLDPAATGKDRKEEHTKRNNNR
jgi:hypothetical protein